MDRTGRISPLSDPEERRVLYAALDSFRQYRQAAHYNITHLRRQAFYSLPSSHIDLLSEPPFSLPSKFDAVDDAIDSNADIAEAILAVGLSNFGIDHDDWKGCATPEDLDKARSTLRQLYREWSAEGVSERLSSFSPIYSTLEAHLTADSAERYRHRVLVPGAGLGRLAFDLYKAGYTVYGNEISYHQLLASDYILNHTRTAGQHQLYPWALSFNNHMKQANQLQAVSIPDIDPTTAVAEVWKGLPSGMDHSERMNMIAGDFCELHQRVQSQGTFDSVATCFFIDTAPNVIRYIDTIRHCLKPGGLWINLGPLLWHFKSVPTPAEMQRRRNQDGTSAHAPTLTPQSGTGTAEPGSFELTDEEVIALVQRLGFTILEHKQSPAGAARYIQDPSSMLQNAYWPSFWIARKL